MPAFFTHYAFGVKNYKRLEYGHIKNLIQKHRKAYSLGTIGPDIFFYFFPDLIYKDKKPASVMHELHSQLFFENMLKRAELFSKEKQQIAYAYIAGFIGHYELDVHCHPYVYAVAELEQPCLQSAEHFSLEAAMDVYCSYEYLHRLPTQLHQKEMIHISRLEKKVIATLLADAYKVTYRTPWQPVAKMKLVLSTIPAVITCLEDKKGWKESVWERLEHLFLGHVISSPLFINNNTYSYTVEDWYQFHELWKSASIEYQKALEVMEHYVAKKGDKKLKRRQLLKQIGNHSYHAGKTGVEECKKANIVE